MHALHLVLSRLASAAAELNGQRSSKERYNNNFLVSKPANRKCIRRFLELSPLLCRQAQTARQNARTHASQSQPRHSKRAPVLYRMTRLTQTIALTFNGLALFSRQLPSAEIGRTDTRAQVTRSRNTCITRCTRCLIKGASSIGAPAVSRCKRFCRSGSYTLTFPSREGYDDTKYRVVEHLTGLWILCSTVEYIVKRHTSNQHSIKNILTIYLGIFES